MAFAQVKKRLGKLVAQSKKATYPQLLPHLLKNRLGTFAPLLGAGIRLELLDFDNGLCVIGLPLTRLNSLNKSHFGSNLHMMADPFLLLLLTHLLGKDYQIVESESRIEFVTHSQDKITARIKISHQELSEIVQACKQDPTIARSYTINLTDNQQKTVAIITKTIAITHIGKHLG